MLGISNEVWLSVGTVSSAVAIPAVPVIGWMFSVLKSHHQTELATMKDEANLLIENAKNKVATTLQDLGNQIDNIEKQQARDLDSLKAAWVVLDGLRINGVSRQDQDRFRNEIKSDMEKLGDRFDAGLAAIRADFNHVRRQGNEE